MKTYNGERRYCTVPTWFGLGAWYVKRFNDLCKAHDDAYENQMGKWAADKVLLKGLIQRGYWPLAVVTFFFFITYGFWAYYT